MKRALVVAFGAFLALAACGGGGGGGNGPTATNPTAAMEMLLRNTSGAATFQRLSLFFDETRLGGATVTEGSATSPPMHANTTAAPGRHTIRAVIEQQTATPSTYVLSGTIQYSGRTLQVASAPTSVATGGSVEVAIDL